MSAAVNSMIGAQSDSIGRGAEGSESGEESGALESRASQRTWLVFDSIVVEIAAPEGCPTAGLSRVYRDCPAHVAQARIR